MRMALEICCLATEDRDLQAKVIRMTLQHMIDMPYEQPPPYNSSKIFRKINDLLGIEDPYHELKNVFNNFALDLYPALEEKVKQSSDPFRAAVILSLAGNIIDAGMPDLSVAKAKKVIDDALNHPLAVDHIDELQEKASNASSILFLGDNAGEIVFDRLLIDLLPKERVVYAVKRAPVLNDATLEDAKIAGLTDLVEVIDNGADAPGTVLSLCSESFKKLFYEADLVIAKGQGNYEGLSEQSGKIYFLFMAKCPTIAKQMGCDRESMLVMKQVTPNTGEKSSAVHPNLTAGPPTACAELRISTV
jgi:uncharacterized protein with ATP-grasp and redox domains